MRSPSPPPWASGGGTEPLAACATYADCGAQGGCGSVKIGCDDGNPCTADTCAAAKGCVHALVADGSACGTDQICASGVCTLKTP